MNCFAEINIKALRHNIKELMRLKNSKSLFMAVVKANAYGHGAVNIAEEAIKNGANFLGVARIEEAIELRQNGINCPILIFGYTSPDNFENLCKFDLTQTVYSSQYFSQITEALSNTALRYNKKISVHIKIDTGMGRVGFLLDNKLNLNNNLAKILQIANLKGIKLEGIFTHFASSDNFDKSFANFQFEIFLNFVNKLNKLGLDFEIKHAANSAALIDMPNTHLDMVRVGIALYGLNPSNQIKLINLNKINLEPVMTLKAKIINLKKVQAGFKISYNSTYETKKPTVIATVSIGYADGLNRLLSSNPLSIDKNMTPNGFMLIKNQKAPIIGRICMDLTMLDVGHISNISIGDEVIIFGKQKDLEIKVDDIAQKLNTINYEIVSTIAQRVKRLICN